MPHRSPLRLAPRHIAILTATTLLATISALSPGVSHAQDPPRAEVQGAEAEHEIRWASLPGIIDASWRVEHQPAWREASRGLREERASLPGRVTEARGQISSQTSISAVPWSASEQHLSAGMSVAVGPLPKLMRALVDAQLDREEAAMQAARWEFAAEVSQAYTAWWLAAASLDHLDEDLERAEREALPLHQAAAQGELSQLDFLDVQIELGALRQEHASARKQEQDTRAHLGTLLNASRWKPALDADAAPDEARPNPWRELGAALEAHPALRALREDERVLIARADLEERRAPATIDADAAWTTLGWQATWITWQLGVTIPLSNPGRAEARRLRAQASGVSMERQRMGAQLQRELEALARGYEATQQQLAALDAHVLEALLARQTLLDAALEAQQVTLLRVLRARRELHEAHHARYAFSLSLHAAHLSAALMRQAWEPSKTYERR